MRYCDKCGIEIIGERKFCPLCQNKTVLAGKEAEEVFPVIPFLYKKHNLFFRLLIFASVIASMISLAVNIVLQSDTWWSLFVIAGILCMWLYLLVSMKKKSNLPKSILYQVFLTIVLALLWDLFTGWHTWSIDFVVPIICCSAMLAILVLSRVFKLKLDDYIIYLIIDACFGILPFVFLLTGLLSVTLPSLICIGVSILSLVALLVFHGDKMLQELKRRLHI